MGFVKKAVKKVTKTVSNVAKGILGGGGDSGGTSAVKVEVPEAKVPAQQIERQQEVGADEIQMGTDVDTDTAPKGKRSLVRPVASSLGGM